MASDMTEEIYKMRRNNRYASVQHAHFRRFYDYLVDVKWFRIVTAVFVDVDFNMNYT